jgi:NAD(P)-dependent dehydrogenase (short-subunit alcohol dehydrogenase family)
MKLNGKTAVITGGSRGIGKTIAEFFVREGARVFILSRDKKEIAAAMREIEEVIGLRPRKEALIQGFVCDVSDAAATLRIIRAIGKKTHGIDILVNCAGIQAPIGPFAENKTGDWEKNIAVNLFGTMHACKAVLPFMIKRRRGSIINFSGGGATSSRPNFSAYAVAKTGVVKLTEILADELAPYHVKVNAIAPGAVNTFMLAEVLAVGEVAGKAELAASKKRMKEGGISPEVAAALAVFLASHDSDGLTGRLISAPWDAWRKWDKKTIKKIAATDKFKLRRL